VLPERSPQEGNKTVTEIHPDRRIG
jgi:hypothetical protein